MYVVLCLQHKSESAYHTILCTNKILKCIPQQHHQHVMKMVYLFSKLDVYISTDEKTKLKGFLLFFVKKNMYMKINTQYQIIQFRSTFPSYHMTMCNCPMIYSLESPIIRLLFPKMLSGSMQFLMARIDPKPTSPTVFLSHGFLSLPTRTLNEKKK